MFDWRAWEPHLYSVLYADWPWHFRNWSADKPDMIHERGRGANKHYPTMKISDGLALPVADLMASDSMLFMWLSWPHLEDCLALMKAWGFKFKSRAFTWVKPIKSRWGGFVDIQEERNWHFGMGYGTRANDEVCLLGSRGKGLHRLSASVRALTIYPVMRHSEKPPKYDDIRALYGAQPSLELFARKMPVSECGYDHENYWDSVGNEVNDGADIREVLPFMAGRINAL